MIIKWEKIAPDIGAELFFIAKTQVEGIEFYITKDSIKGEFFLWAFNRTRIHLRFYAPSVPYYGDNNLYIEAHKAIELYLKKREECI